LRNAVAHGARANDTYSGDAHFENSIKKKNSTLW
jgi:hypothetical protein